jgi:hypothetical protein
LIGLLKESKAVVSKYVAKKVIGNSQTEYGGVLTKMHGKGESLKKLEGLNCELKRKYIHQNKLLRKLNQGLKIEKEDRFS